MSLRAKMLEIDLNQFPVLFGYPSIANGMADEHRANDLFAAHGLSSAPGVSSLRGALWWRLQSTELFLSGSISLPCLRTTDLSRKPPRYRSVFAGAAIEALPHGLSRPHLARDAGRRQREPRLANLPRLRTGTDPNRSRTLSRRTSGNRFRRHCLCLRLHHHRSVSDPVPLGTVSQTQECRQAAHVARCARLHSDQCLCDRSANPRCQSARRAHLRAGSVLPAGPWLHRFRAALYIGPSCRLLRHPRQTKHSVLPSLLSSHRPILGSPLGSNHRADRAKDIAAVSDSLASRALLRRRETVASNLPDQQLPGAAAE